MTTEALTSVLVVLDPQATIDEYVADDLRAANCQPWIAASVDEALRLAEEHRPSVAIFDWFAVQDLEDDDQMKAHLREGCAFLRAIRDRPALGPIEVVIIAWLHLDPDDPFAQSIESMGGYIRHKLHIGHHSKLVGEVMREGAPRRPVGCLGCAHHAEDWKERGAPSADT